MAERALQSQIAAITGLYLLAYLTLAPHLDPRVTIFFCLLIILRAVSLRWRVLEPGRWLLLPLTVGALANVHHAYHTIVGQEAGTALLASMLGLKLLEMRKTRDVRVAATLFCFLLVSRFLFDQSPWIALLLGVLLVGNVALLADLNARAPKPLRHSVRLSLRLLLQAIPLTLLLFALFPRLDAPLWRLQGPDERARTGIKPWLEPGSVSELVVDGTLAFRVRFDGAAPGPEGLYWRGPVAWNTDGRRWLPADDGQFAEREPSPASAEDLVTYEVTLEPNGHRWLFALDIPSEASNSGARISHDFQVLAQERTTESKSYRVTSALSYSTGELPPEERAAGLKLPSNVTDRMRALVAAWQGRAKSPASLVREGLDYFSREPFYYSLLAPKLGNNPADEFLFETRKGFCEHYAASFAVLMRIGGIPSRVVMGYLGGEINPLGGHLIVRQSNAHAWTEIWLEGRGWSRVDPTASIAPARVDRSDLPADLLSGGPLRFRVNGLDGLGGLTHGLALLADAIDENWRRWVLDLDRARQLDMLEWIGLRHLREYGLAVAMLTCSAIVLGLLVLGLIRGNRETPEDPAERLYRRFCGHLGRLGFQRHASEGPMDYGVRVAARREDLERPILGFTRLYADLRYGLAPPNRQNLGRLGAYLVDVRKARSSRPTRSSSFSRR